MTKAFLYDSLCGLVYRCMFAGVDGCGRAQWVNITPGEEAKKSDLGMFRHIEDEAYVLDY